MELSRDFSPQLQALLQPLRRHVTPYRFCWILVFVSFLIAWNRGIALLYAVVALTLAAILLSHLLAWTSMRALRVVREPAAPPAPGEAPLLRYRLAAPGRRHFLLIDEPSLTSVDATLVTQFDRVSTVERDLAGLHRGAYRLGVLHVSTAYPFGLLTRRREVAQKSQEIVVYPRLHEVQRLPEPSSRAQSADAEIVVQRRRGWDEFAGVREQRPGESLKHVHWRATARQNQLMVKEYETLDVPGMLIVLPQQRGFECGTPPHSCFEYAVELAASLTRAACRAGHPVHCVSAGWQNQYLQVAANTVELSAALEWFARVTPDGTTSLTGAVDVALRRLANPGWLVTFRHRGEELHAGPDSGRHLDFVFDAQSFRQANASATRPPPQPRGSRYDVACHAEAGGIVRLILNDARIYRAQGSALAVTAVGALWTVMDVPGLMLGLVIAAAGFGLLHHAWSHREQDAETKVPENVAACGLAAAVIVFIVYGLANALIVLLLGAQLALNSTLKEHRQLKFGWMTSFVTLVLGAVHATSSAYLLVFCLFALFLLLGVGYAWLDKHNHSPARAEWSSPGQWRVAAGWLFAAFVLYLITPRLDALLWGAGGTLSGSGYYNRSWDRQAQDIGGRSPEQASQSEQAGSSDDPSPTTGTRGTTTGSASRDYQGFNEQQFDITQPDPGNGRISNVKVLSMQAPHSAYLRVRSFDEFDGVTWSTTLTGTQIWRGDFGEFRFDGNARLNPNFNQHIEVLAPLPPAIPGTAPALAIHFPAAALRRTEYGTFEAPRRLQASTRYSVESQVMRRDGRFFDSISPAPRPQDTRLPAGFDTRIAELANEVTAKADSARAKALALETHLRTQYDYSLATAFTSQNRTPLSEFLFETRHGHCEFFASALAAMLRTQNIPSRLATGYSATTYNPVTGRYEMRVLDGHAWVEAWIDGGWMLLEPTPFYPLPQPQEGRLTAEQIETYLDRLEEIDEALGQTEGAEFDLQRLLLVFWQSVIEAANLIIAAIAWVLLSLWPLWVVLAAAGAMVLAAWHWRRDALLDWWADRQMARYRFVNDGADFLFVFGLVQDRMTRRDNARLPGQSLAAYCGHLHGAGLLSHDHTDLHAASEACFVRGATWESEWRDLLLAFYDDVKQCLAAQTRATH